MLRAIKHKERGWGGRLGPKGLVQRSVSAEVSLEKPGLVMGRLTDVSLFFLH